MNCSLTPYDEGTRPLPRKPALGRGPRIRFCIARWIAVAAVVGLVVPGTTVGVIKTVREARRQQCAANLKRLGFAFREYHDKHGHFPPPALAPRNGAPLLSWRVALLPSLGYQSLYDRFHLNEAWDSPHNRALLEEMPPEFACPGGPGQRQGQTGYVVIIGPTIDPYSVNSPFDSTRGVDLREITDGTSNTILVLETDTHVPWTKPHDLHWAPGGPLPVMASPHIGGANALFADGSTRFLKPTISSQILLAILTINGGEIVST